jgi:hypothetical protein
MSRFLDWLDESAAGVIRVAYLLAGVIAVASYFSDGNVPKAFSDFLNTILPWALAGALEIHTYLTARRVRKSWQDWSASSLDSDEHERAWSQLKLNLGILAGLLLFSMYNQLQYLAATWSPPDTPLTPPGPWAYLIRAIITPAAFMAAAFLAPVGEGLALQVQSQAHALAVMTFKVAVSQWKRRLRQMQQAGQDVTGALVQLVDDPAERRVISAIWQAMQHPGQAALEGAGAASTAQPVIDAPAPLEATGERSVAPPEAPGMAARGEAESSILSDDGSSELPTGDRPPTGPGSPTVVSKRSTGRAPAPPAPPAIKLISPPREQRRTTERRTDKKTAARANARSGKRGTAETRIRALLASEPSMSHDEVVKRTGVSSSTASKWIRVIEAERAVSAAPIASEQREQQAAQ